MEDFLFSFYLLLLPFPILVSQDVLCALFLEDQFISQAFLNNSSKKASFTELLRLLVDSQLFQLVVLPETLDLLFSEDIGLPDNGEYQDWIDDHLQSLIALGVQVPDAYQYTHITDPDGTVTRQREEEGGKSLGGLILADYVDPYSDPSIVITPSNFTSIRHLLTDIRRRQRPSIILPILPSDRSTQEQTIRIQLSRLLIGNTANHSSVRSHGSNTEWFRWKLTFCAVIVALVLAWLLHHRGEEDAEDRPEEQGGTARKNSPKPSGNGQGAIASPSEAPPDPVYPAGRTQSVSTGATSLSHGVNMQVITIAAWHHLTRFNRTVEIANTGFNRQQTQNIAADLATSLTQNIVDATSYLTRRVWGEQGNFSDRPALFVATDFAPEIAPRPMRIVLGNPNSGGINDAIVRFNREVNGLVNPSNSAPINDLSSPNLVSDRIFDRTVNSLSVNFFNRNVVLSNGDSVITVLPLTIDPTAPPVFPQPELPAIGPNPIEPAIPRVANPILTTPNPASRFSSGVFTVSASGVVGIDYLYDGGDYQGQLGIFSLSGLEAYELGSSDFIRAVAQRVVSESPLGHIVIKDATQGAKLNRVVPGQPVSLNQNQDYTGVTSFTLRPGDQIGLVMIPNGTFQDWLSGTPPAAGQTLFLSLKSPTSQGGFTGTQFADANRERGIIGVEDVALDLRPDKDYNDMVFQIFGATGQTNPWESSIQSDNWLTQSLGQAVLQWSSSPVSNLNGNPVNGAPAGIQVQGDPSNFGQGQSPIADPLSPTREPSNSGLRANSAVTTTNPLTTDIRLSNIDSPFSERQP